MRPYPILLRLLIPGLTFTGMLFGALVPPLWFNRMNGRIDDYKNTRR